MIKLIETDSKGALLLVAGRKFGNGKIDILSIVETDNINNRFPDVMNLRNDNYMEIITYRAVKMSDGNFLFPFVYGWIDNTLQFHPDGFKKFYDGISEKLSKLEQLSTPDK